MLTQLSSKSYPFPQIDQQQARRQLEYLGYKSGNSVYLRFFYHSSDPRKNDDLGRKLDWLRWKEVEAYQRSGRGVYVVVNGSGGGHEDKNIVQCAAIFCEWDDRPVEDQLLHWETVGFLEPTFTVYSGDKSAQPYWVFDTPVSVEQWRSLQLLLIEVMGADPSNKNPSRVFRLAGGWHVKPGREPVRTEIVQDSGKKYSPAQLLERLREIRQQQQPPVEQPTLQKHTPPLMQPSNPPPVTRYEDIQVPVSQSVPLFVCLSKESRTLLESGVGEGGRNTNGAKLARDLQGTASYLQTMGQQFDGDPRQMLDEYASRCTPPLQAKEVDSIWKSAEKNRPTPSCKAEGVEACIKGWYWNNERKPNQAVRIGSDRNNGYRSGRGFGGDDSGDSGGAQPPIAAVSLCSSIREILNRYDQESLQVSALMDLASAAGRTYNEISQLARIIRAEGDLADEVIEAVKSLQGTLNSCRKRLDIARHLDSSLAGLMIAKAKAMPTAPEYLFNTLLPVSASRIGTAARVIINPQGGYKQPCIFWTANVANSGQAKTPPQEVVIEPLDEMEALAHQHYEHELELYSAGDGSGKTPKKQHLLLKDTTTATKIRIHGDCPRGVLEYIDELMGDYERLNQFKGGKGDDLRLELSFWNGGSCNYNRNDVRLYLKRTAINKTGTYQWDTLARLMQDEVNFVGSGYSARFLYCSIVDAPARYLNLFSDYGGNALKEKLRWLYGELGLLPEADYLLSHEAKVLFQGWNHTLINAEIEEPHYGLSLVYAKIEAYTARIALWLHLVNAVLRGEKPKAAISGETMQNAIEIASFYLWQHKLIHAHNSPTRKLEGIFLKVQTLAEKFFSKSGKGMGASFAKSRINSLKNWVVEKIRCTVFKTLADTGHGQTQGEGTDMVYIPNTVPGTMPPDGVGGIGEELVVSPIAETTANTGVHPTIGEIGDICPPVLNSQQQANEQEYRDHQFTNLRAELLTQTASQPVGNTTNPPPTPPIDNPPGGDSSERITDEEMAVWRSRLNDCQTLDDATDFFTALDTLPQNQRHQFELTVPESRWAWLYSLPQSSQQKPKSELVTAPESVSRSSPVDKPESVPEPQPEPTLESLRAMLLACDSLVQLTELMRLHKQSIATVYNSMSQNEQAHVDGLAALKVPYKVFKYTGDEIRQGQARLIRGTLVYFDPTAQVRTSAYDVPVWALNGVSSGWKHPIYVSLNLLLEVVKAVLPESNQDGGQQMGLI